MKVAYLVNLYPKVSHTFIRREIVALEALGVEIDRFSVRRNPEPLVDADDRGELERTRVILDAGLVRLALALLTAALMRPIHFARALAVTIQLGVCSDRGVGRHLAYLAEACLLCEWLVQRSCTHLHAHFGTNAATVALICRVLGGPPYSFTVHGPEEFDKARLLGLQQKIERARFVVAISSFGRSQLYRNCSYQHWPKVHIVRCGLDAAFLRAPAMPITSQPRMVSVGRLSEQKGQLLLIEAAALVGQRGVDFELVLVGDGELRGQIEAAIAARGLEDRVHITGWVDAERVRQELAGARVFVLPSFAEGLPVALMEAFALGRPVVATYVAGIPELVSPECGWLVPAASVELLGDAMQRALSTPDAELERMGRAGQIRVREQHDAAVEAAKLRLLIAGGLTT